MPTTIEPCNCKHPVQDKLYGLNMRVFNLSQKFKAGNYRRCTVCGKTKGSK